MKRVLLVNMPFVTAARPAIGISLLKAALARDAIPCDIQYFNLLYARRIGVERYERICNVTTDTLLPEYVFAPHVFGARAAPPEQYCERILAPAIRGARSDAASAACGETVAELTTWVRLLREQGNEFLDECLSCVQWNDYALVGFTTTFHQTMASLAMAALVKQRHPSISIVFGGANCEAEMGAALHRLFPVIDYVCSGEGDLSFPPLAKEIVNGLPPTDIPGILRRAANETVLPTAKGMPVSDMDALPVPDYDDYVQQVRARLGVTDPPQLPFETARGCWWGRKLHCTFCGLNGETMQFRVKSADRALSEIVDLTRRYGARQLFAVDNIIAMDYFTTVLPQLASMDLGIELFYETKANLKRSHVRLLRDAGVVSIQPGIESLSSNVLRIMRKGVTAVQNIQLLRWCAEYMLDVHWNVLAGFPGETPEDYARQTEIASLLFHLTPPTDCAVLRLDRFSPLFLRPEQHGLCNVRPRGAYAHVFPVPEDRLFDLAYYFAFDYADGRNPNAYLRSLQCTVGEWRDAHSHSQLLSLQFEDRLVIWDTRPVAVKPQHWLSGTDRLVYEYCDEARTRGAIETHLAASRLSDAPARLDAALARLVEARLLLHEDDRWLSLGVAGDYQLDFLARHLAAERPVPAGTSSALTRLYETDPDLIRALVRERLREKRETLTPV